MPNREIRIAWVINAYRKPEQIIHIIDRICGPCDSVWLHYDKKSPVEEFEYLRNHYRDDARVHCYQHYRIHWGGTNIVMADVYLGRRLLASGTDFDYVIHLTGTTYPIATMDALRQYLAGQYGKSLVQLDPDERIHAQGAERSRHFAKEHFGVTPGRNIPPGRLGNIAFRLNLKRLRLLNRLGMGPGPIALPKSFPEIYRGYVHNLIFKDHYQSILRHRSLDRFLAELKYVSCPDEVFFNTMLLNVVPREAVETRNNLLITYWMKTASPIDLTFEDIPRLLQSGRFFARKFEDLNVLKEIDRLLDKTVDVEVPAPQPAQELPGLV